MIQISGSSIAFEVARHRGQQSLINYWEAFLPKKATARANASKSRASEAT